MDDVRRLLELTASMASDYLESLDERRVFPDVTPEQLREALGGPLPEEPVDATQVVHAPAALALRFYVGLNVNGP